MRSESYQLNVIARNVDTNGLGAGIGLPQSVRDLTDMVVEINGTFTGDLKVQVLVHSVWITAGTVTSGPGLVTISHPASQVRINTSALAADGASLATAWLVGFNAHSYG